MPKIKKGKVITFFSAKGGVGKTISVINLAGIFRVLEKKVLIIDLDLAGGGISVALNKEAEKSIYHLSEDINTKVFEDFKNYVTNYDEYIDFIASPKDPRQASKMSFNYIEQILDKAKSKYDVVLIDTNHFLSDINLVTLDASDQILFLLTNEPLDLKNMKSLISIFKDLEINKYKIILNNSTNPYKDYFALYDIKNIINNNINYQFTAKMYVRNIDSYVMNGKILTLDRKFSSTFPKDYQTLMTLATDILSDEEKPERGDTNE